MKNLLVYSKRLKKAIRLLDHFVVETAKASQHQRAVGNEMLSEDLTELVLKLQDVGLHMDLAEMRLR